MGGKCDEWYYKGNEQPRADGGRVGKKMDDAGGGRRFRKEGRDYVSKRECSDESAARNIMREGRSGHREECKQVVGVIEEGTN